MPPDVPPPRTGFERAQALPPHRPVTLLLDAGGALLHVVRADLHEDDLNLPAGLPLAQLLASDEARAEWARVVRELRADPTRSMEMEADQTAVAFTSGRPVGAVRRRVTAIPITADRDELAAIVVRFGIARELDGLPDPDEERFRFLAETVPHMLWMARLDSTMEYFSPSWVEFTGLSLDALLSGGHLSCVHPDDLHLLAGSQYEDGTYEMPRFRLRRHDGEYRWVEVQINTVLGPTGEVVRVVGSTTDVTERVVADAQRAALLAQLEAAAAVAQLGRFATDHRTGAVQVDDRFLTILGLQTAPTTRDELAARFPPVHPDDLDAVRAEYARLTGGETGEIDLEFRIDRPGESGRREERWISLRGRHQVADGTVIGTVGVIGDVTERRAENAALLRAQKREALGTLAGGIAHDFNNVISAILSNAAVAEAELAAGVSPAMSLEEIRRGAERAADVVRRLLGFSRESEAAREPFDLASVVREACDLLRPTFPAGVSVHAPAGDAALPVLGSASELHQVVLNLVGNACDAATDGGGGTVSLLVDDLTLEAAIAGSGPEDPLRQLPTGRYVRLRVVDDGPGIPPEALTRLFDPFFTTKEHGKGTGLGLAAAQSIVRSHGGEISAANRTGGGVVFTVLLPAVTDPAARPLVSEAPAPAPQPSSPDAEPTPAPGSPDLPHVLFVDDEEVLARLATRALPLHGCRVTTFTDPSEALEALRASPGGFDVLITDLAMPGFNGLELAAAALEARPGLPVILTSGFITPENEAAALASGVREVVPKPVSLDLLALAALRLTAARSSAP